MRTFHRLNLVLLGMLMGLCGSSLVAQIVSTNPNTANAGQSVTMVITGNNTNFTAVTGFQLRHQVQLGSVYSSTGFVANSTTNASATFNIPPNAPLGFYRLEAFGIPNFNNALNVGVGQGSNYGWVSGRVIDDRNGNCIVTNGTDIPIVGGVVQLSPGQYLTTDANGEFGGWVPLGNYTASYQPVGCNTWICPAGGTQPVSILTPLSTDANNNFHFSSTTNCSDLNTTIYTGIMRPGFTVNCTVLFRNYGPYPYNGAVGSITLPSQLTVVSTSVPPTTTVGNTLSWNLSNMAVNSTTTIHFSVLVPSNIGLGIPLTFSSNLPNSGIDPSPSNNTDTRTVFTQGSYDPNDKRVWDAQGNNADGPVDPSTSFLKYMIRFQNTGTDTAFNIFVRDTLDAALNPATLRVRGSSHSYQLSMSGTGNVQFTFPNILLVDSFHNEPLSHGWIEYEINTDAGLPVGTTIRNDASIYFDYNAPVVTNTTNTTLCALISPSYSFTGSGLGFNFTNTSTGGTTYSWDFGDGATSTSQNPSHNYTNSGDYEVCLTVSNSCRSETYCDTVSACLAPVAGFTYLTNNLSCAFTNGSTNGGSYLWDFGDGNSSTLMDPIHNFGSIGDYVVCLTVTNACSSATTCDTISVCEVPIAAFTSSVTGNTATFTDGSHSSTIGWTWDFGDGGNSTQQNPVHTYSGPGTYTVCLTTNNGCDADTRCDPLTVLVGIADAQPIQVHVSPNPSADLFMVEVVAPEAGAVMLKVMDLAGRTVLSESMQSGSGISRHGIDLNGRAAGMYLLQVRSESGATKVVRLVKE